MYKYPRALFNTHMSTNAPRKNARRANAGEAKHARHTERLARKLPKIETPSDEWLIATDVNNLSGKN